MPDKWNFSRRKKRTWLKVIGGIIGFFILAVAIIAIIPPGTPAIKGVPNSIASLEKVNLGGIEQWILMRGHDANAPVILFLHGGPGNPQISVAPRLLAELEQHFVVVNWDQRGSGKSWSKDIDPSTMTVDQFVLDTLELTQWLKERFGQEKIYLVGHSWGSYIGALAAQQSPEYFHAYVGVGQMVSFVESEELSYQYTIEAARREDNDKAVAQLETIGRPPYDNGMEDIAVQRKWLDHFGGLQREVNMTQEWLKSIITRREYTLFDAYRYMQGANFSGRHLFDCLTEVDLFHEVPELKIPVYLVSGKYDYITVSSLTERYYQRLEAPAKEYVLFEKSAHLPLFEERELFTQLMVRIASETE